MKGFLLFTMTLFAAASLGMEIEQSISQHMQLDDIQCDGGIIDFPEFVRQHGREYLPGSEEYALRFSLFQSHAARVKAQNCRLGSTWVAGINHLADRTETELAGLRGFKRTARQTSSGASRSSANLRSSLLTSWGIVRPKTKLPASKTWNELNALQEDRDQAACGSCWAFASNVAMRAHAEIAGKPQNFSVSQLVACTPNPRQCGGAGGCDGATVELAYNYVMKHGSVTDEEMPYPVGGGKSECPSNLQETEEFTTEQLLLPDGREVHMTALGSQELKGPSIGMLGWTKLPENKLDPLMQAVVQNGPVAVALSSGANWNLYNSGILKADECSEKHVIDHAVVLFGFDTDSWHIKNSWGKSWGEKGNIRLERLKDEQGSCYWDKEPLIGTGCEGGPKQVRVCGSCGILYDAVVPHFRHTPVAA